MNCIASDSGNVLFGRLQSRYRCALTRGLIRPLRILEVLFRCQANRRYGVVPKLVPSLKRACIFESLVSSYREGNLIPGTYQSCVSKSNHAKQLDFGKLAYSHSLDLCKQRPGGREQFLPTSNHSNIDATSNVELTHMCRHRSCTNRSVTKASRRREESYT
ncbi:hypothetical protein OE88DRAFT_179195 [Heliocybe sulcata]|uniref:Uncharacterized protein n=1 Tax=Heliocybe sulcata TaxID=5364 RepID=A0A5C3N0V5_9AGAM|nr:hypothetical protein OE88DRAFT_179195 [Heliocybe sulcata]